MTAPTPNPNTPNNAVPAGLGSLPPGKVRVDPPKRPHLNVIRFLNAKYGYVIGHEDGDPNKPILRWTIVFYRDSFYVWVGAHWRTLAAPTLEAEMYEYFKDGMYVGQVGSGQNAVPAWMDFDPDPGKMNALMKGVVNETLLDQEVNMPVWFENDKNQPMPEQPVSPYEIVPCQNGLLNTNTRLMWALTPRYFNSFSVSYDYDENAPVPQEWLTFLKSVWPDDQQSIDCLQEWFGYLLTQRNDQQKMLMLYGAKRAGKGTIIRVLTAMMGENNVTSTSMAELNDPNFGLAGLPGKQLAVMGDLRFRSRDDGTAIERLLKITGDDTVLINRKHKDAYPAHLTTRFLIASNELPKMQDESGALQSRIVLLKFKQSFLGREDHTLEERLMRELPGVLNWSLDGLKRLNKRIAEEHIGFIQPDDGKEDLKLITELSSPIIAFITECCELSPAAAIPKRELFGVWKLWCQEVNQQPGTQTGFGKALKAVDPSIRADLRLGPRGQQKECYGGIDLNTAGQAYRSMLSISTMDWTQR